MTKAGLRRCTAARIAIVGGGIIGLSIAWRLHRRGLRCDLYELGVPGQGASHAAAGMLSVIAEADAASPHFFDLCRASRALWPDFATELAAAGDVDVSLQEQGTLLIAQGSAQTHQLAALEAAHSGDGTLYRLTTDEVRQLEPNLRCDATDIYFAPQDGQVDNRAVIAALVASLRRSHVALFSDLRVQRLMSRGGRVTGLETATGPKEYDVVIVATGVWTDTLLKASGLEGAAPSITPVQGQMLALQMDAAAPSIRHVIRGETHYLVPRPSGRLIIGATSESGSWERAIDRQATDFLRGGACRLVPALAELPIIEEWTGLRPLLGDGLPLIGETLPGLVLALGHHRNGVLLAPITAELVAGVLTGDWRPGLMGLATGFAPRCAA